MASGGVRVMEKPPNQLQQQRQQQPQSQEALKCPRCDSSNTKFCYYNNYSLSQPRHFCKACKRYWTRGGTLRNVPVGGGCRKNKRVKRPITTNTPPPPPPTANHHQTNPNPNPNPDHNNQIIPSSSTTSNGNMSNHHLNPLFYGLLPQNPNYPRFDSTSIISETAGSLVSGGYDLLQPHHINAGLGFSGTLVAANHQGHINSNSTFSSYMNSQPMYAGGSASSMASLLASSLITSQQQRYMGFASYDDDGRSNSMVVKDLKIEAQNRRSSMDQQWNNNNNNYFHGQHNKNDDQQQQQQQMEADPNSLLWDSSSTADQGGVWLNNDPNNNNIGSSVPSLI